jgi:hypothetical protein
MQGCADRFGGGAADYDAAAVKRHRPELQIASLLTLPYLPFLQRGSVGSFLQSTGG